MRAEGRRGHVLNRAETWAGRKDAGGAGIKRLVCFVLGPPDLMWPGGLSMPPAARLARGFCSPRGYLPIADPTVHLRPAEPQTWVRSLRPRDVREDRPDAPP